MRIALIAGGTGGAKLAEGFAAVLPPGDLDVIVNVGDDLEHWGLHVSPDADAVLFRLAGLFDRATGYGIAGDTHSALDQLRALGEPAWFTIGDRDLAFHVLRTRLLREGASLTAATLELGRRLGVESRVLPVTDDPLRTWFRTDRGDLSFQEHFVRERLAAQVLGVEYRGIEAARPSTRVVEALAAAERVVIGPSNPVASVWPVLHVVRDRLVAGRTSAVCPTVGGRALKGPTVEMMRQLGRDPAPAGVAAEYRGLASEFVLDTADADAAAAVLALGYRVRVLPTVMESPAAAASLAEDLLAGWEAGSPG